MKSILMSRWWLIVGLVCVFGRDLYGQNSYPSIGDVLIGVKRVASNNITLDTHGTITHTWNGNDDHRYVLSSNGQIDFGFPAGWDAGALKLRNSANGYAILTAGGGYVGGGEGKLMFFLNQTTTPQVVFRANGNVGIGTDGSNYKLEVNGTIKCSELRFANGTSITTAGGGSGVVQWVPSGADIYYSSGSVGIGTASPQCPLHIERAGTDILKVSSSTGNYGNHAYIDFRTYSGTGVNARIGAIDMGYWNGGIVFEVNNNSVQNSTVTTEAMRILNNGNVGIGTSPGQKLSVAGIIQSTTGGFKFPDGTVLTTAGGGGGAWATNGSDIYSSNSGNVGIGKNPSQKLDVNGAIAISGSSVIDVSRNITASNGTFSGGMTISGSAGLTLLSGPIWLSNSAALLLKNSAGIPGAVLLADGGNNIVVGDLSNAFTGRLILRTKGQERMCILGEGRVGIGTPSPGQALSVAGTIESTTGGFKFPDGTVQTTAGSAGQWTVSGTDIYSGNSGRVGIGKTPSEKLDVAGAIAISGTSVIDNGRNISAAGGTFTGNMTISGSGGLTLSSGPICLTNSAALMMKSVSGTSGTVLIADAGNNIHIGDYSGALGGNLIFRTAQTERMRILSGGNLLIGKTSQQNGVYKLDVAGSIRASEVVVNTDGADFVFEDGYKLMDLHTLSMFVKENKHLPDIAPSEELQKCGIGVGDMQTKLLQKIEELTLYVIDQEKRIQEQNRRIEKLEKENAQLMSAR